MPRLAARHERGSASPILAFVTIVLAVLGIGGVTIARVVAARTDAQRAADSGALATADLIRTEGMQAARAGALGMAERNSRSSGVSFVPHVTETDDSVLVTMQDRIDVSAPRFVNASGAVPVAGRGVAKIGQFIDSHVELKYPRLALVLDYSGSMSTALIGGGGKEAIDLLEDSVKDILDEYEDKVKFAATFFESSVHNSVHFPPQGNPHDIRANMDQLGPMGGTCTECGFNEANQLFEGEPNTGGFFVLLVSDGEPNDPGAALAAADQLWQDRDPTIFTLHIDYNNTGGRGDLANFMRSVSGTRDHHPDDSYYFPVSDASNLDSKLKEIIAAILCTSGPLTAEIDDPESVNVFLRDDGGHETKVPKIANLAEGGDSYGFQYDASSHMIRMTYATCETIMGNGEDVVIRFNRAKLIE